MKKYYIRGIYSDWHEVSKKKYEEYRKYVYDGIMNANNEEHKQELVNRRCKEVEE